MITTINSSFTTQDFNSLETTSKRAFYQEANETHNFDLVRQLNNFGMKPIVPSFSGPSIISNFMDIATKYDTLLGFLKELRESNRLLTEKEFQPLSTKKWIQKSSLSRLLGCNHLMRKISENGLPHMKIPFKLAVITGTDSLKINGSEYPDNHYDIYSDQIIIFAEEIKRAERKLSKDEIDELIQIIAKANFLDLWPSNIVVAEDGVYFIDTELKSFAGPICWGKMGRFESLIREADKAYFWKKVQEKMDEPKAKKENNGYDDLENVLGMLNEFPQSSIEKYKDKIEDIKSKMLNLEYVGAKKVGSHWSRPNIFTFELKDILT